MTVNNYIDAEKNFIKLGPFILFISANTLLIIASIIVFKLIWVPIDRLYIKNIKQNSKYKIGVNSQLMQVFHHLRAILKNLMEPNCYIANKCGFQAYTFIYFQRTFSLVLTILTLTDICMWVPYQLFFIPLNQFSLVTMPSAGNQDFRTFYTIWIASIVLYSIYSMLYNLRAQLRYKSYHDHKSLILNSLKARTLHVNFLGQKFISEAYLKCQIQQYMVDDMGQQDTILAVLPIPNYAQHLEVLYQLKIIEIVDQIGVANMSCLWKLFKEQPYERIRQLKQQTRNQIKRLSDDTQKLYEGCFIIVIDIETGNKLIQQFQLTKAWYKVCPDIFYSQDEAVWRNEDRKMVVKWAQQPKQIQWINMTAHTQQILNFFLFNILCILLLILSFAFIAITSSSILQLPHVIAPLLVVIVNSTLRWLISKMVEWQNRLFRSESQIKQFKILCIYFFLNVIIGSMVRNTLNLIVVLQTGWGFIELLKLIYSKIDGYFYYLFIFTQTSISFMDALVKPGQLFPDVFQVALYYQKVTQVKQKSIYAKNDSFRYGYSYAIDFIVIAVILLYSVSNPLIHIFGVFYFYSRYHLNAYTLTVFHHEEVSSNMRLICRVTENISIMVALWIFLTATSLIFDRQYSNSTILYLLCGAIIYYASSFSKQFQTLHPPLDTTDIKKYIQEWQNLYTHPFHPQQYIPKKS